MSPKASTRQGPPGAIAAKLGADKKKVIIAVCLIAVMAIMWLKVIFKKGPETVAAVAPTTTQTQATGVAVAKVNVIYTDLPVIENRNDRIARNVFDAAGWQGINPGGAKTRGGSTVLKKPVGKSAIETAANHLIKLEALTSGPPPQAMINGKLLSKGDKLLVGEGSTKFEFEVIVIEESGATLKCANVTVKLALAKTD